MKVPKRSLDDIAEKVHQARRANIFEVGKWLLEKLTPLAGLTQIASLRPHPSGFATLVAKQPIYEQPRVQRCALLCEQRPQLSRRCFVAAEWLAHGSA